MKRFILYTPLLLLLFAISGCNYNLFDDTNSVQEQWNATHKISELTNSPYTIKDDIIVEGVVVANDSTGNFYNEFYIQEATTSYLADKFYALRVRLNYYDSYINFPTGSTIAINLKGLVVYNTEIGVVVGVQSDEITTEPELIPTQNTALTHTNIQIRTLELSPQKLKLSEITSYHIGQSVLIDSLYFKNQVGSYSGAKELGEIGTTTQIKLNTSSYSDFAASGVQNGVFNIEAIVIQGDTSLELKINSLSKITKL